MSQANSSTSAPSSSSGPTYDDAAVTTKAYAAAAAAHDLPSGSSVTMIQAVYLASNLAGSSVVLTTGTLQQTGANTFSYSASPQDRLHIAYSNGTYTNFFITQLSGNFLVPASQFFDYDYGMAYRFVNPNLVDISVTATRTGSGTASSVSGTYVLSGITYTASGSSSGTVTASVDSGFAEATSNSAVSGGVTANGFSMTVDETRYSRTVVYNGTISQYVIRTINDAWQDAGTQYTFANAQIKKAFVDNQPGDFNDWAATGSVQRNGNVVGALGWGQALASVQVYLDVNGERTVLEEYAYSEQ